MDTSFDFDVIRVIGSEILGAYEVDATFKETGWVGGAWAKYSTMTAIRSGEAIEWKRVITAAGPEDPMIFILRGSYEATDQFTSRYPKKTGIVTCCLYGQYLFKHYEVLNKAERHTPGSGAPLVYTLNTNLYVSENGLLTSETEAGASTRGVGLCCGLPADNENYLGCEILIGPW